MPPPTLNSEEPVNPLSGVWAGLPKLVLAGPRADWRAGVRIGGPVCGLEG